MPIADVDVVDSAGWWMQTLARELVERRKRLDILDLYYRGTPPVPVSTPKRLTSAFYRMIKASRLTLAQTIVLAGVERMAFRAIRVIGEDQDEQSSADGDAAVMALVRGNDLPVSAVDVHNWMYRFGCSYVAVGAPREARGQAVITEEDPREMITAQDPTDSRRTIAALKMYHDSRRDIDYVYLWIREEGQSVGSSVFDGAMYVATQTRRAPKQRMGALSGILDGPPPPVPVKFSAKTFDMRPFVEDLDLPEGVDVPAGVYSERYQGDPPVHYFPNRDGVGEYELHTDLLDRINHMILQRMVIATLQAFKQRGIESVEGLPKYDEDGKEIDYDNIFEADPGALWRLPAGAKIWESAQVDLTGILAGAKDDMQHLAVVTRTPFSMFMPTENQSAEGAQLAREGLVFKVEDRERIAGSRWARVIANGFDYMDDTDEKRRDPANLIVDWYPVERYSLAERASADSQALSLPVAEKYRRIWQMTPDEVQIALAEKAADALREATIAAQVGAPGSPNSGLGG